MSKALPKARAIREIALVIGPIFTYRKYTNLRNLVFLCNPTPPYNEETYRDIFDRTRSALMVHLKDHRIIDQSVNHVTWEGDGESYHFLLSRGCRGAISVEVRVGTESF